MAEIEATVYKLSTGNTSDGGTGDQFFVELKSYASLREEQASNLQSMHSLSEEIKVLKEHNENLEKSNSGLMTDGTRRQEELNQALNEIQKIGRESNDLNPLQQKVEELEKYNQQLEKLHTNIQEVNDNKIKQLEELNQSLEKANSDLIIHSTRRQEELKQALIEARNTCKVDSNQVAKMHSRIQELENYAQQLHELNASVKQANADITDESQQKLAIALDEVRKANAAEKALKIEKAGFLKELEESSAVVESLNAQITKCKHENTIQDERINELIEQTKEVSQESEATQALREKFQKLYQAYQGRMAEISQLKLVNDRIGRENTKWEKQIRDISDQPECKVSEHGNINQYFVKIRETFLKNNNTDEGSEINLPDGSVSDLIVDVLKEHANMKQHYAKEIKGGIAKIRKLGRDANDKEEESDHFKSLFDEQSNAVIVLNKKLAEITKELKLKEKDNNKASKDMALVKKHIQLESQKANKGEQMFRSSQKENEQLTNNNISLCKEISQLKTDLAKAVERIIELKRITTS